MTLDLQVETKHVHNLDNAGQLFSSTAALAIDTGRLMLTTVDARRQQLHARRSDDLRARRHTARIPHQFVDDTMTLNDRSRMLFPHLEARRPRRPCSRNGRRIPSHQVK
jgi:hypothetical protein